jgi:class 3 adenylate cyclase/tetratricopeptide (TPR) repeat protein/energy-coupling factor transporter ATP-binding protein EcfA2
LLYQFENYSFDVDRQELRRGGELVPIEPQVLDLLHYLIRNRERVVSKDDLIANVWNGRIVSESTLTSRITSARQAIGDSGEQQRLIRTIPRKGLRFIGKIQPEEQPTENGKAANSPLQTNPEEAALPAVVALTSPERRQLTIMVCDLIGLAPLSTRLDPEDLSKITTDCHRCVSEVIEQYGGFVAKYATDQVVVYFGYPRAHEDDAERAVRAALVTLKAVSKLRNEFLTKPLQLRVGIASGLVVVGDLRVGATIEHSIAGEIPHLVAGLLVSAEPGTIVISDATRRLTGGLFEYRDIRSVVLKGSAKKIRAFQVLREGKIASRFEALRSRDTELIGREEELELLLRRWNQVKLGEGRIVLIWGEPGIGKSRLVTAIQDAVKTEAHTSLRFYCSPHRTQTALHPVISQLEHAAGFGWNDSDVVKLDKLESVLALSSQEMDRDVALIADLLSISTLGRHAPLSLSPQRRKELLLDRLIAQTVGLAARQPVLMILEDAHWIDPTTRELFDRTIERIRSLSVLLIVTYRPEFVPPWLGQSHVTTLTLNRLGRRENATLIRRVARGKELPASLLEQIITRTDGVPLFIEEMTKSVLESDELREKNGAYVLAAGLPVLAVPETLQGSLAARLDRLGAARAVVQTGAALGREFTFPVLKAVIKAGDAELEPLLDQIVASQLVHQRGAVPHAIYSFKHALVQDAAHESLIRSQRAQLHCRIKEVLEQEFPETPERNPDVLAYHCTEAGLWDEAINYWLKSADMALDRSAGVEAQAQVEQAMSLVPKVANDSARDQLEGRLQVTLGSTFVMTKGFASSDVAAALLKARGLLDESIHPLECLRALGGLFGYHLIRSESPHGLKLIEPYLQRSTDRLTDNVANYYAGAAYLHIGNFSDAKFHLEKALSLYDEDICRPIAFVPGHHIGSFTLVWLSLAYLYLGMMRQATETMSAAIKDARGRSHPFTLMSALLAEARFRIHRHDLDGAVAATDEGFAIAIEQRSPYHLSRANILRAVNVALSERPEEGIALMEKGLVAHRETGANFQSSFNLSYLAIAYARAEKFERALEIATQAVNEVERTGERWWEAEAQRMRGEVLLAASSANRNEAETCFKRALECARQQNAKFWELRAAQSLAQLWSSEKRHSEARELFSPIYAEFSEEFNSPDLNDAKELSALLDQNIG